MKRFDGLDPTYPPEKFLSILNARITFQLGIQPRDPVQYAHWQQRRMAFLYVSLDGTAQNWFEKLPPLFKEDWSAFLQLFRKQFCSQKLAYHAQLKASSLVKKDNESVRSFALQIETFVKQGWCNEHASTMNLKCNEFFYLRSPQKVKRFRS